MTIQQMLIEDIIANETLQYNRDIDQIQAIENGTVDIALINSSSLITLKPMTTTSLLPKLLFSQVILEIHFFLLELEF